MDWVTVPAVLEWRCGLAGMLCRFMAALWSFYGRGLGGLSGLRLRGVCTGHYRDNVLI